MEEAAMKITTLAIAMGAVLCSLPCGAAYCETIASMSSAANAQQLARIVPGKSTKADVRSLLGAPWREMQFNDCGMAMDDQSDETWEYRGSDGNSGYRIHVEFDDNGVVHLVGKIPDRVRGGEATNAKVAPPELSAGMSM
jgi:hypothetical protein